MTSVSEIIVAIFIKIAYIHLFGCIIYKLGSTKRRGCNSHSFTKYVYMSLICQQNASDGDVLFLQIASQLNANKKPIRTTHQNTHIVKPPGNSRAHTHSNPNDI